MTVKTAVRILSQSRNDLLEKRNLYLQYRNFLISINYTFLYFIYSAVNSEMSNNWKCIECTKEDGKGQNWQEYSVRRWSSHAISYVRHRLCETDAT